MKSVVAFFHCFLLVVAFSWANNNPDNNLPTYTYGKGSELVKKQLLAGTWATSVNLYKDRFIFDFNADGTGHLIEYDYPGARHYRTYKWSLNTSDGDTQVNLEFYQDGRHKVFTIASQEEKLIFTDLEDGKKYTLNYVVAKGQDSLQRIAASLQGRWENATYAARKPSESGLPVTQDISLSFDFADGGSYERVIANNVNIRKETGTWELSKDGQYIFFHSADRTESHMVKIKFIEGDELVLEQLDASQGKDTTNTKIRDYFFNKI